jgi:20S proteasome alpha/beta subunit
VTVLVGVRCKDGIVVGSDSSATFGADRGVKTIEQRAQKIFIVEDKIIIAGTGEVGLGQRFTAAIREAYKNKVFLNVTSGEDFAKKLCVVGLKDFQETGIGPGAFGAMVAFPIKSEVFLCELAITNFQPELKVTGTWFCSMGSGQQITDPFLGFLKRVFFPPGTEGSFDGPLPNLKEAMFLVTWALANVIELNPGGINGPPQMAVLSKDKDPKALYVHPDDLEEDQNFVKAAEKHLGDYLKSLTEEAPAEDVPKP